MGGCAADAASSWLGHRPERVGAWGLALSSRQPAGPRREGRSRAAVSVTGAPPSQRGRGRGWPRKAALAFPEARRPSVEAAGSRQPAVPEGRRRGQAAQPLPGWSCRPARVVAEEPRKRISSSAEPTSAQRFLGPSSPVLAFSVFSVLVDAL